MSTRITELEAKLTADVKQALSEIERVKQKQRELAESAKRASSEAGAGLDALSSKADKTAKGVAGITNALYAMEATGSARVLALGNSVGNLVGMLGPQGKLVQGATIAATAMVSLFLQAKEKSEEARKSMEEDIRKLVNAADLEGIKRQIAEARVGTLSKEGADGLDATRERIRLTEQEIEAIERGARAFASYADRQRTLRKLRDTLADDTKSAGELEAKLKALTTAYDQATKQRDFMGNFGRELLTPVTVKGDTPEKIAKDFEQAQRAIEKTNEAIADLVGLLDKEPATAKASRRMAEFTDQYERAGIPVRKLQQEIAALTEVAIKQDGTAQGAAAQRRLEEINSKYGEQLDLLAQIAIAAEEADGVKAQQRIQQLMKQFDALNDATSKRLTLESEQRDQDAVLREGRERTIADLERELAAVTAGTLAYEEYLRTKAGDDAVREERERLLGRGKELTPEAATEIRNAALRAFDLQKSVADAVAKMKDSGAGKLAAELAEVAQHATQIATSLGDAGRSMAVIAGIAGQAFNGIGSLQNALQKRDEKGNVVRVERRDAKGNVVRDANGVAETVAQTVGFWDAVRGKNGSDSQAKALTGAFSIVGAAAMIADQLDLFGTKAKQRKRELEEASRQFQNSLADFVASLNPQRYGDAIRNARRQAEELAKQAAAAVGGRVNFKGQEVSPELLRAMGEEMQAALVRAPKEARAQMQQFAGSLLQTASALEKAEEAARKKVLADIEDLGVSRLRAAGLNEQADARAAELAVLRAQADLTAAKTDLDRQYYAALLDLAQATQAATEAAQKRAEVERTLSADIAFLGGTNAEQIALTLRELGKVFPALAGLDFSGLDLSTAEGLNAALQQIRELYLSIREGGVSEAEAPIVAALQQILQLVLSGLSALPPALEPVAQALEILAIRTEVFGLSFKEQLDELLLIFAEFDEGLSGLLSNVDTGSREELERFRTGIQDRINEILADGEITEEERPIYEALRRMLTAVNGALSDIEQEISRQAREAEEAARAAEQERQQRVRDARRRTDRELSMSGRSGTDAVRSRLGTDAGLSPILSPLLDLLGDGTSSDIARTRAELQRMFRELIDGGGDISQFGDLTRDEIIDAIVKLNLELVDLERALDDAAKAAAEAARVEREATEDLQLRLIRATGGDTRLEQFELEARRQRERYQEERRSQEFLDFFDKVIAAERSKLLGELASENSVVGRVRTAQAQTASTQIGGLTSLQGDSIMSYLRSIVDNTARGASATTNVASLLSRLGPAPVLSSFPALTFGSAARSASVAHSGPMQVVVNIAAPVVQLPQGTSVTPASLSELGSAFGSAFSLAQARELSAVLGQLSDADVRYLGSNKL